MRETRRPFDQTPDHRTPGRLLASSQLGSLCRVQFPGAGYNANLIMTGAWSEGRSHPRASRRTRIPLTESASAGLTQMWSSAVLCWPSPNRASDSSTTCRASGRRARICARRRPRGQRPAPVSICRLRSACGSRRSRRDLWLQTSCSSGAMLRSPTRIEPLRRRLLVRWPNPPFRRRRRACGRT